jgi:hypothetical protein
MPVYLGALRAKLILGVDDRVLIVVAIVALMGMFTPLLFLVAGGLFGIGRIVGAISPYFFDELSVYINWRLFAWNGVSPDDAMHLGADPKFVRVFKRAKA